MDFGKVRDRIGIRFTPVSRLLIMFGTGVFFVRRLGILTTGLADVPAGRLEKPACELKVFAKTKLFQLGESEMLIFNLRFSFFRRKYTKLGKY